jgi:hypothetical protein
MQFIRETHSQQKPRYDSITMVMLEFFEMVAFIGLLFCLVALTHGVVGFAQEGLLLYTVWFAVATVGTYAMKRGDPLGRLLHPAGNHRRHGVRHPDRQSQYWWRESGCAGAGRRGYLSAYRTSSA